MDKTNQESKIHDFMSVESFSQLPFIRPAPVKEKAVRLFGIDFGSEVSDHNPSSTETSTNQDNQKDKDDNNNNSNNNNENNRRFECHYCCRNFPTSQALGGHQNAHKRERQHAKRVHLQSAMAHHHDAHIYAGLMNYTRFNSAASLPHYPSWNISSTSNNFIGSGGGGGGARVYGNHASYTHQTPINGSPLGLWRLQNSSVPSNNYSTASFNRDRSSGNLVLLAGDHRRPHEFKPSEVVGGSSMKEQVSLDLHL